MEVGKLIPIICGQVERGTGIRAYIVLKPLLLLHCHLLTVELVHCASARTKAGLTWLTELVHSCPL